LARDDDEAKRAVAAVPSRWQPLPLSVAAVGAQILPTPSERTPQF
jgi:hypothetical protein